MKNITRQFALPLAAATALAGTAAAHAQDEIVRPYQSVRSAGMGNVRYTTGLYDQNYFANPARVTANPTWKVTLLDPMVEMSSPVPSAIGGMIHGGSDFYKEVGDQAGENYHVRVQTTFPSLYIPPSDEDDHWGFAVGLISSTQADVNLRRSFNIDPTVVTDIGPAVTVGYRMLEENELSIGMTTHLTYRLSSNTGFTFVDLIKGRSLSPSKTGGQGTGLDFDLGSTYDFHWHPLGTNLSAAFAVNNVVGGKFSNISFKPIKQNGEVSPTNLPLASPRTFNFGGAIMKPTLGIFHDTSLALEFTDFGNNTNGSIYRTIHLGTETHLLFLALRGGINQGYLAAGVGLNFFDKLSIDAATYGEELSLNAGGLEDRRYALRLALEI